MPYKISRYENMSRPRFKFQSFELPKSGENALDIQDCSDFNPDLELAAIADGVSSSTYPREWASLLVHEFCRERFDLRTISRYPDEWLKEIREEWLRSVDRPRNNPGSKWMPRPNPRISQGSSTFIGIQFQIKDSINNRKFSSIGIGDSCLFQFRRNSQRRLERVFTFPHSKSSDFSSATSGINTAKDDTLPGKIKYAEQDYLPGDLFFLATDALAEFIFIQLEQRNDLWLDLLQIQDLRKFQGFISYLREQNLIKDDDTTIVYIKPLLSSQISVQSKSNQPSPIVTSRPETISVPSTSHAIDSGSKNTDQKDLRFGQPIFNQGRLSNKAQQNNLANITLIAFFIELISVLLKISSETYNSFLIDLLVLFLLGLLVHQTAHSNISGKSDENDESYSHSPTFWIQIPSGISPKRTSSADSTLYLENTTQWEIPIYEEPFPKKTRPLSGSKAHRSIGRILPGESVTLTSSKISADSWIQINLKSID
jgi:hypothetical protein